MRTFHEQCTDARRLREQTAVQFTAPRVASPVVSVVVCVRDDAPWLGECLDSVLAPGPVACEVLIAVAGEHPLEQQRARDLSAGDDRVGCVLVDHDHRAAAANAAALHARGQYLIFLDGHDIMAEGALARHMAQADATTDVVLGRTLGFERGRTTLLPFAGTAEPSPPSGSAAVRTEFWREHDLVFIADHSITHPATMTQAVTLAGSVRAIDEVVVIRRTEFPAEHWGLELDHELMRHHLTDNPIVRERLVEAAPSLARRYLHDPEDAQASTVRELMRIATELGVTDLPVVLLGLGADDAAHHARPAVDQPGTMSSPAWIGAWHLIASALIPAGYTTAREILRRHVRGPLRERLLAHDVDARALAPALRDLLTVLADAGALPRELNRLNVRTGLALSTLLSATDQQRAADQFAARLTRHQRTGASVTAVAQTWRHVQVQGTIKADDLRTVTHLVQIGRNGEPQRIGPATLEHTTWRAKIRGKVAAWQELQTSHDLAVVGVDHDGEELIVQIRQTRSHQPSDEQSATD